MGSPPWTNDPNELRDVMRAQCAAVMMRVRDLGLPLEIFETRRSEERQRYLFSEGASKIRKKGAHVAGLAFDVVVREGDGDLSWRTGLSKNRRYVIDPVRFGIWRRYGALLRDEFPALRWGGRFGVLRRQLMGWDPYHAELKVWRKYPVTSSAVVDAG